MMIKTLLKYPPYWLEIPVSLVYDDLGALTAKDLLPEGKDARWERPKVQAREGMVWCRIKLTNRDGQTSIDLKTDRMIGIKSGRQR